MIQTITDSATDVIHFAIAFALVLQLNSKGCSGHCVTTAWTKMRYFEIVRPGRHAVGVSANNFTVGVSLHTPLEQVTKHLNRGCELHPAEWQLAHSEWLERSSCASHQLAWFSSATQWKASTPSSTPCCWDLERWSRPKRPWRISRGERELLRSPAEVLLLALGCWYERYRCL